MKRILIIIVTFCVVVTLLFLKYEKHISDNDYGNLPPTLITGVNKVTVTHNNELIYGLPFDPSATRELKIIIQSISSSVDKSLYVPFYQHGQSTAKVTYTIYEGDKKLGDYQSEGHLRVIYRFSVFPRLGLEAQAEKIALQSLHSCLEDRINFGEQDKMRR